MAGSSAKVFGTGAQAGGNTMTVSCGGAYLLSGVHISCSADALIYGKSANKAIIALAAGTENSVTGADT